ncbi:MAG: hypothetical protein WBK46_09495 [Ruminococcus flavefaciens]
MIVKSQLVEKHIGKNIGVLFGEEKRCELNPYSKSSGCNFIRVMSYLMMAVSCANSDDKVV